MLADRNVFPAAAACRRSRETNLPEIHRQLADPAQWKIINEHHLVRTYKFPDFKSALAFRESTSAHSPRSRAIIPTFCWHGARSRSRLWTHAVDGLTESDFILAAKIDRTL